MNFLLILLMDLSPFGRTQRQSPNPAPSHSSASALLQWDFPGADAKSRFIMFHEWPHQSV